MLLWRVITLGKVHAIIDGFAMIGFPNCVGGEGIDSTHTPILVPNHQASNYINRKG